MKKRFSQQITAAILAIILTSCLLSGILAPKKASAGGPKTPGEAVGQALAAGTSCFLAAKIENFVQGLISKYSAKAEGMADAATSIMAVPSVQTNAAEETAKLQTTEALSKAKECIIDVAGKILLDWLVDETVAWIQDDGYGKPRYVTNWNTFSEDAFNIGVGQFAYGANLTRWLCKPFGLQVKTALQPIAPFSERIKCTMNDINVNLENFGRNFLDGGWLAYEYSLQPQNNFYGAYYMTVLEAEQRGQKSKEAAEKEAMSSGGWLSAKECVKTLSEEEKSAFRTQADLMGFSNLETYLEMNGFVYDFNKNWCSPENLRIVTPGERIAKATDIAMEKDSFWIKNLKTWTAALLNAAFNRLKKEGVAALKEGLGKMKKSTEREIPPPAPLPPELNQDIILRKKEVERIKTAYERIKKYVYDYDKTTGEGTREGILTDKKQSLTTAGLIKIALDEIKKRGCLPAATDEEMGRAQKEIDRLNGEITFYEQLVEEINDRITGTRKILTADNFTDTEIILLQKDYADFTEKYEAAAANPKTAKDASAEESAKKQNELALAQSRLSLCSATSGKQQ